MSNKIVIANWKMNPETREEAEKLASSTDGEGVVICPPFVFMETVLKVVKKGKVGAQNCFYKEEGAFTGEVSPLTLKNMGCEYVIVGHSERRNIFEETSDDVNKKIKKAMECGLKTVVCVGETKECTCDDNDYENAEHIKKQLQESLLDVPTEGLIIAYEPISAVGSGCPIPVHTAKDRINFIKKVLAGIYQTGVEKKIPIFYGGSVGQDNASSYLYDVGFDGLLVGGASLDAKSFNKIYEVL